MNPTDAEVAESIRMRALLERAAELEANVEGSRRQVSALERKLAWTNGKMREIDELLYPLVMSKPQPPQGVLRAWAIARENS